jgi:eukaryotic-like serine/threonine-protein kinase
MITEPRILAGRYHLDEFLGRGGMARVYRGTDLVLGRTVAVKLLAEHLALDPAFVERFRREARAAARLGHPGVVAVYDSGSEGETHFIVMEHVEGRTLEEVLSAGPLPIQRAVEIARKVAEALSAAHAQGLVHRDVKPGNVMIGRDGSVKVMDFGIARALDSQTMADTRGLMGTAAYLAPEHARGEPTDPRSDVYSLGIVLYHMLTGRPPFLADSPAAVIYQHLHDDPIPPSRLDPAVGPELEATVLRAMAKDPAARPPSAEALRAELDALPIQATTAPGPEGSPVSPSPTEPLLRPTPEPTERLIPPPEPATRPIPAVPPRTAPGRPRNPRRPRRAGVLVALAAVVFGGALAFALAAGGGPGQAATERVSLPAVAEAGVSSALSTLESVLNESIATGDIEVPAARSLARDVRAALDQFSAGAVEEAAGQVEGLAAQVDDLVASGAIASVEAGGRIQGGLTDLAGAIRDAVAAQPPDEGKGKGKGHDDDDGHGHGGPGGD